MTTKGEEKPRRWLALGVLFVLLLSTAMHLAFFQLTGSPPPNTVLHKLDSSYMRAVEAAPSDYWDNLWLLARVIQGEAGDEPYTGKVGVAAVLLNRVRSNSFPKSISGVVFEPYAFESVSNGIIWRYEPSWEATRAASAALSGWDPTYGALFFWNPSKPVSSWIWSRQIITQIGNHVFAR